MKVTENVEEEDRIRRLTSIDGEPHRNTREEPKATNRHKGAIHAA